MNVFQGYNVDCELHAGANVVKGQIGIIVFNDPVKAMSFSDELQHIVHRYSSTSDARLAKMDTRIDGDSLRHLAVLQEPL